MSADLSKLKDVMAKGEELSKRDVSFAEWYEWMISNFGVGVRPYLRDAWKHLKEGTSPVLGDHNQASARTPETKPTTRTISTMKSVNWITFAAGLACGLVLGFGIVFFFGRSFGAESTRQGRFILIHTDGSSAIK